VSEAGENPYAPPSAELAARKVYRSPLAFAFDAVRMSAPLRLLLLLTLIRGSLMLSLDASDPATADFWLAILGSLIVQPLLDGVALAAAGSLRNGVDPSARDLAIQTLRTWLPLLVASLIAALITLLGLLFLILPGLYFFVRLALMPSVVCFEGKRPGLAPERSGDLVAERFWTIAGLLLLFAVPVLAIEYARAFAPLADRWATPAALLGDVVATLVTAAGSAALAYEYFEISERTGVQAPQ
jgi:hypothetical protein